MNKSEKEIKTILAKLNWEIIKDDAVGFRIVEKSEGWKMSIIAYILLFCLLVGLVLVSFSIVGFFFLALAVFLGIFEWLSVKNLPFLEFDFEHKKIRYKYSYFSFERVLKLNEPTSFESKVSKISSSLEGDPNIQYKGIISTENNAVLKFIITKDRDKLEAYCKSICGLLKSKLNEG